jgi:hypothetical protein
MAAIVTQVGHFYIGADTCVPALRDLAADVEKMGAAIQRQWRGRPQFFEPPTAQQSVAKVD